MFIHSRLIIFWCDLDVFQVLPKDCDEFEMIKEYVTNTHAPTHSSYALELLEVFNIERHGESKRYKPFRKLPNRKLLWHGSRTTNFAGILSQGLRIAPPEAPVVSVATSDITFTIVTMTSFTLDWIHVW